MADVHVTMSGRILPARRLHRVHSHIADFSQALPTELCVTVSGGNMSNTMQCNRRNTVCHLLALSNTPMTALNINTSAETRLSPESLACTIARRHDLLMCLSPNSHVHKYTDTRVHTHMTQRVAMSQVSLSEANLQESFVHKQHSLRYNNDVNSENNQCTAKIVVAIGLKSSQQVQELDSQLPSRIIASVFVGARVAMSFAPLACLHRAPCMFASSPSRQGWTHTYTRTSPEGLIPYV